MRLAVISDTHLNQTCTWFEEVYEKYLAQADCLVHCGDMTGAAVLRYLGMHDNFHAVRGNCDWEGDLSGLPQSVSFEFGGLRVAAVHGWGNRSGVPDRVAEAFGAEHDLVCYGHTHTMNWTMLGGVRILNPGSLSEYGSLALVDVEVGREPVCRFVEF